MIYPPDFTHPEDKADMAAYAADTIAKLAPAHRVAVQAGGCSGLWPLALAQFFDRVITFEPAPENFRCLQQNVAATPSITAYPYAVGEARKDVGLTRPKAAAGLWRVDGDGPVPMATIDAMLSDEPVDAIVLDVEGYELQALEGAAATIELNHPLIWFEWADHGEPIRDWLAAHGYVAPRHGIGLDCYSVHASSAQA